MKRRIALLLAIVLVLSASLSVAASAADVGKYTDISGHWAKSYIEQAIESGLMTGESSTAFSPNKAITRGQFVTVLGRFAGINADAWKMNYPTKNGSLFTDVSKSKYYAPYVNWATRTGVTRGVGHGKFDPTAPITREQMLTMLKRYADSSGKTFTETGSTVTFADTGKISGFAKDAVNAMQKCGIIEGMTGSDGKTYFSPKHNATRAQAAVIFARAAASITAQPGWSESFVTLVMLDKSTLSLSKGKSESLKAQTFPADASNGTVTWLSDDPNVASVDTNGKVKWVGKGSCTVYAYSANGCKASCVVICKDAGKSPEIEEPELDPLYYNVEEPESEPEAPVQEFTQDLSLTGNGETYEEKCARLFGSTVSDPRTVYQSEEEARQNIVSIEVPAWDFDENGGKYTRWFTIEVHKDLAATIDQIFREIYDCPAQYPIHAAGGFRFVAWSEHNFGAAIDLNPEENYYCTVDGTAEVGNYFSPETDEYSIPVGGEIDRIFAKYGFTRGIYWHNGYRDYMHYSYFGT